MKIERHNGWTNFETWLAWFTMKTNAAFYQFWLGTASDHVLKATIQGYLGTNPFRSVRNALADELEETYTQLLPPLPAKADNGQRLQHMLALAALAEINWLEISAWLISQASPKQVICLPDVASAQPERVTV